VVLEGHNGNGSLSKKKLREAVRCANLPTLVMVLFQLTGERKWLQDPYRPTRPTGLSAHDHGGFSEDVQRQIRDAAVEAIERWAAGKTAAVPAPRGQLFVEMLSACMGEPVPDEFEHMMAEEMGFAPGPAHRPETNRAAQFQVVIIGAGVSGLLAAWQLRKAGIDHIVLEKNQDLGGTWLLNTYPGCGVDTPSYLYSFSFLQHDWSTHFAKRGEVFGYLKDMAERFDLVRSVRFGTEVRSAVYDAATQLWTVTTRGAAGNEQRIVANAVITAVGQLNVPSITDIPGIEQFGGPIFHSARWPDGLELTGKSVAVVGSGASAMQIVPAIADRVAKLTVFQRSPQWIAPSSDYFGTIPEDVHWLIARLPYYHRWYRLRLAWTFNDKVHSSLQVDPEWPYLARSVNAVNDGHRKFFTRYLRKHLDGRPDLIRKALPDYPPFGKRMLLDNGWFQAIKKPNVELVNQAVTSITATGVHTASGEEHAADVIVLATGFQARRILTQFDVLGRRGLPIREVWGDEDARAYLGICIPGFPNLFMMYGPNTNLGHGGSYILIAESQIRYILDLLCKMIERGIGAVECRPDVHDDYNRRVDEAHAKMIWARPGITNYYKNARGRVVTNSPWRHVDYWWMTHESDLSDFIVEPAVVASAPRT
jgi:4-hydroxyacetophenone monooxygenase